MFAAAFARIACSHRYAGFNCAITALMSGLGRHPKSAGRRKDLRCVTMVSYARLFCADLHTHCLNDIIKVIDWYQYNTNLCFRLCHRPPPLVPDACVQDAALTEQSSTHLRLSLFLIQKPPLKDLSHSFGWNIDIHSLTIPYLRSPKPLNHLC